MLPAVRRQEEEQERRQHLLSLVWGRNLRAILVLDLDPVRLARLFCRRAVCTMSHTTVDSRNRLPGHRPVL